MTQPCPNCGTLNPATNRFCPKCGAVLTPSSATPAAEPQESPATAWENATAWSEPSKETASDSEPLGSSDFSPASSDSAPVTTAYVVKTSSTGPQVDPQAPTMPMSTFVPPPPAPYGSTDQAPYGSRPPGTPTGYQGYGPGASARREGATYAPYAAPAVSALEKPQDQRSWLVPVIVAAAIVLVGLVAFSGFLVFSRPSTAGVSSGSQITPLPASASEEDKVRQAIRLSNNNQIKAWNQLDEEILKQSYTGQALTENIQMVRDLKTNKLRAEPVNQKLDIKDVKVTGNTATAHTVEVWTVTYYRSSDNAKVASQGPDTLNETYYLVKQNGTWYINKLVIPETGKPTATPGGQ